MPISGIASTASPVNSEPTQRSSCARTPRGLAVLLEHDVAPHRCCCSMLRHSSSHDRSPDRTSKMTTGSETTVARRHRRAADEGIRIAATARHFDLQFATEWLARFAAQPTRQRSNKISLNNRVCRCSADHRIGLEPVELVAQFLPFLPGEELSEAHALAQGALWVAPVPMWRRRGGATSVEKPCRAESASSGRGGRAISSAPPLRGTETSSPRCA